MKEIKCGVYTYVVSWLNDMKDVSETIISSSPLDIIVMISDHSRITRCHLWKEIVLDILHTHFTWISSE